MRALLTLTAFEGGEGHEGRRWLGGGTQTPEGVGCYGDGEVWRGGDRMSSRISAT